MRPRIRPWYSFVLIQYRCTFVPLYGGTNTEVVSTELSTCRIRPERDETLPQRHHLYKVPRCQPWYSPKTAGHSSFHRPNRVPGAESLPRLPANGDGLHHHNVAMTMPMSVDSLTSRLERVAFGLFQFVELHRCHHCSCTMKSLAGEAPWVQMPRCSTGVGHRQQSGKPEIPALSSACCSCAGACSDPKIGDD
jgi:hypothetical protein